MANDVVLEGDERVDEMTRTSLGWLLAARWLLAALSLGLAVSLDKLDGGQGNPAIWGVYWTVIAAFAATIVSGLLAQRTRNPERFATVQIGVDLAIVTSLVYFSGAGESVFTFLYALVVLYSALALDRRGVALSAGLASLGYGFVLFGSDLGLLPDLGSGGRPHPPMLQGAYWGFYTGALVVLGMLANTLSAELRRTGAALDRRTHDLHQLRDLHLLTVESIASGLLTTDDSARVTSFNPEAERITGVDASEAEGRFLDDLIPGAMATFEDGIANDCIQNRADRGRIPFRNLRGEDLFLGLSASSLRDEDGRELGQIVIFQDVTKVVSMEHELRQSERLAAVGEMAARMAHEIRNPLASISGSVQILQSCAPDVDPKQGGHPEHGRLMGIVVREVERLNSLIGDFLLYSRPAPLRLEEVCLANLVEEVAKMSEAETTEEIQIDLELDFEVRVLADAAQLKSVIWNLWNNGIEAIGSSGRLSARVMRIPWDPTQEPRLLGRTEEMAGPSEPSAINWTAVLEIEDDGMGMSLEVQQLIFEPFFTTKREGTGLGLATVQRIIEQHGGSIQVSSQPGSGTCFRMQLRSVELNR